MTYRLFYIVIGTAYTVQPVRYRTKHIFKSKIFSREFWRIASPDWVFNKTPYHLLLLFNIRGRPRPDLVSCKIKKSAEDFSLKSSQEKQYAKTHAKIC